MDLLDGVSLDEVMVKHSNSNHKLFSMDQLKIHAVCHMRIPKNNGESLASKLAFSEAETLTVSCNEYMATLQRLGDVISTTLTASGADCSEVSKLFSKPFVDLYLGTGREIRETIKLLADTYADMNADSGERQNRSSITMLTSAIERSRKKA